MSQNIIFILTEGDHDVAFIYRIIKANGGKTHNKPIKEYPYPLNQLFTSNISSTSIEDLNIENAKVRFLPARIMKCDENLICIYSIGGESHKERRIELIKQLNVFNTSDPEEMQVLETSVKIKFLFFFDADNKGTEFRMSQIKDELKDVFPDTKIANELKDGQIILIEDIYIGASIFTEEGKDTGMLEDVLIPLMKDGNQDIFEKAYEFLDIHESCTLFKGQVKYEDEQKTIKKKVGAKKFSIKKSLIGTVGQLQMSGKSNTICISDADYLTDAKIQNNKACCNIWSIISSALERN